MGDSNGWGRFEWGHDWNPRVETVEWGLWLGWEGWRSNGRVEVERCGGDAIEYGCDCSGYRYVRFAEQRGGAAGRLRAAGCGA